MNTIGWLFLLAGILTARQVSRGRVMQISQDMGDAFIALVSGDTDAFSEVLARKGETAAPTAADLAVYKLTEGVTEGLTTAIDSTAHGIGDAFQQLGDGIGNIAVCAILLGQKAKGYRWTATGPDYYDCSGLMWRACQAVGFTGARFSTATVRSLKAFKTVPASSAGINDLVMWPAGHGGVTGHIGVVTGTDKFYSARSVRSGIGESSISKFRNASPTYLRYVGPRKSVDPFKK